MVKAYATRGFDFTLKQDMIPFNPFDRVEPLVRRKERSLGDEDEINFYSRNELNKSLFCAEKIRSCGYQTTLNIYIHVTEETLIETVNQFADDLNL